MLSHLPAPQVGPLPGREPLFEWRGLLLDPARSFLPVDEIKPLLAYAARYGFNRLHLHLTDDSGWRFDVPAYPRLAEIAAHLPKPDFSHYDCLAPGSQMLGFKERKLWRSGYYNEAEIRDLIAYADQLGIEIIPEVDLPGHMGAAIEAYPHLGRPAGLPLPEGSMREGTYWPARNDLLWPTDEALKFVDAIIDRICELFPSPIVHLGGDECAYKQWESDPDLQDWLYERGYSSARDIQAYFLAHACERLRAHGRRPAAWDEVCELGNVADQPHTADQPHAADQAHTAGQAHAAEQENTADQGKQDTPAGPLLAFMWDGEAGEERLAKHTGQFIYTDQRYLYLNKVDPQSPTPQKGLLPTISLDDVLTSPWPLTQNPRCKGVQVCFWGEFIYTLKDWKLMAFPRLLAASERMWNAQLGAEPGSDSKSADALKEARANLACEFELVGRS